MAVVSYPGQSLWNKPVTQTPAPTNTPVWDPTQSQWTYVDPTTGQSQVMYIGSPDLVSQNANLTNQLNQASSINAAYSNWENVANDLSGKQTGLAQQTATAQSQSALADAQNRLAMRGGLSSGASERLASDAMAQRESMWNQLASQGMLGAGQIRADIAKEQAQNKFKMQLGKQAANAIS